MVTINQVHIILVMSLIIYRLLVAKRMIRQPVRKLNVVLMVLCGVLEGLMVDLVSLTINEVILLSLLVGVNPLGWAMVVILLLLGVVVVLVLKHEFFKFLLEGLALGFHFFVISGFSLIHGLPMLDSFVLFLNHALEPLFLADEPPISFEPNSLRKLARKQQHLEPYRRHYLLALLPLPVSISHYIALLLHHSPINLEAPLLHELHIRVHPLVIREQELQVIVLVDVDGDLV